ncbi:MAG: cytochrome P450 [Actinomycetales bacterium]|nr:cytochrome P450 [Actinomycetales bacterium]
MDNVRIQGHKNVRSALRDTEHYSSDLQGDSDVRDYRQIPLEVDPPKHHAYRSALSPLFVRPKIQSLEPEFRRIAQVVINDFEAQSGGDFVTDVALKYVVTCLGAIYSRPQDVAEWLSWGPDVWTAEGPKRSGDKLHGYLNRVFMELNSGNSSDVWEFTRSLEFDGNQIDFEQFKGIGSVLLAGGRDTVVKLISGTMWHLLNSPADVAALIAGEVQLESAIQEMLRVFTPLPAMLRVTPEQQGLPDSKRDSSKFIAVDFASANYDEEVFENPEVINIRREKIAHVAFGFGPHTCIGGHIAEIETRILFTELLSKISGWKLSNTPKISWTTVNGHNFPERIENLFVSMSLK